MFWRILANFVRTGVKAAIGLALVLLLGLAAQTWLTVEGSLQERTHVIWAQVPKSSADIEGVWTAARERLEAFVEGLEATRALPAISPPDDPEEMASIDPSPLAATALRRVNQFRAMAGVPAVDHNHRLDEAAIGHSRYLAYENVTTHYQINQDNPHYVAAIPSNRIALTSYWGPPERFMLQEEVKDGTVKVLNDRPVPPSGEVIAFIGLPDPAAAVAELMAAPYHRMGLLSPDFCDLGYGQTGHQPSGFTHVIKLSCARWPQRTGQVILYPAPDQTAVSRSWVGRESPDPYRVHGGAPRQPGYPVTLTIHGARQIELVEASLQTEDGASIVLWVNHPRNDVELTGTIILLPQEELPADTQLVAKVTVRVAGETVQRVWSFRTR